MNDDSPGCLAMTICGSIGAGIGYVWGENLATALVLGFIGVLLSVPVSTFIYKSGSSQRRYEDELRRERLEQQRRDAANLRREKELRRVESHKIPPAPAPRLVRDFLESEQLAAGWIRHMGWASAKVTQLGQDSGIDVIGHSETLGTVVAQVKMEGQKTGRPVMQNLAGAGRSRRVNAKHLMFFSSAGFARSATEWANEEGIALFRFTIDGSIQAENQVGRRYLAHEHLPQSKEQAND